MKHHLDPIQRYSNPEEQTRKFSDAEKAELDIAVDTVDDLAARTGHSGKVGVPAVVAELGIEAVAARCRELDAAGHTEAADAIRAELPDVPEARPFLEHHHREHRLATWFTTAVITAVDLATHHSANPNGAKK